MMKIRSRRRPQPDQPHAAYKSTLERAPRQPAVPLPQGATGCPGRLRPLGSLSASRDLTKQRTASTGERIIVAGKVWMKNGDPLPNTLVEIWQCNSAAVTTTMSITRCTARSEFPRGRPDS